MKALEAWKDQPDRIPLIIRGARQVGKTWIMREFGKQYFEQVIYINFDNNLRMKTLFEGDFDIKRIIMGLEIETDINITPSNTLLIFDEIQEVPQALSSLKYFRENAPEYAILAAGSLLGVALHEGTSFPVGKVDFMDLYPMNFFEFLDATENGRLVKLLQSQDWDLIHTFKDKLIHSLRLYYVIGGMPEAVAAWSKGDLKMIRRIQTRLLEAYEQDFSKHAPNEIIPRIRQLWNAVPAQLAKENQKFIYGQVREGARARDYEMAMQWLLDCGLIHKVNRITKPDMPLSAYTDPKAFKLFMLDVGLLGAKSGLDIDAILDGHRIFEEFKGALTEQYVFQQLLTNATITPYYWTAGNSAEVDFVYQKAQNIVPVEVKSEENLRAKSLRSYHQKFSPNYSVRTSMTNYRVDEWLTNIPLYAIGMINTILEG